MESALALQGKMDLFAPGLIAWPRWSRVSVVQRAGRPFGVFAGGEAPMYRLTCDCGAEFLMRACGSSSRPSRTGKGATMPEWVHLRLPGTCMARPRLYSNEQIIAALKATNGLVLLAAERLGADPDTIYTRAKSSQAIAKVIRYQRAQLVDLSELKLRSAILNGQPWAVSLVLKTLGKDRGYVERQELTGKDGGPVRQETNHVQAALAEYDGVIKRLVFGAAEESSSASAPSAERNGEAEEARP